MSNLTPEIVLEGLVADGKANGFIPIQSDPPVIWDLLGRLTGEVAWDVGANGGAVAAMLAGGFDVVVAFEPCQESYEHLVAGAADNVMPMPLAVSDHTGYTTLTETAATGAWGELVTGDSLEFSWGKPTGSRVVPCSTLDDLLVTADHTPDFIKIDVEGHELAVIRGGEKLWAGCKPRLLIEVHSEDNGQACRNLLERYRYSFQRVDHPGYQQGGYGQRNHYYLIGAV